MGRWGRKVKVNSGVMEVAGKEVVGERNKVGAEVANLGNGGNSTRRIERERRDWVRLKRIWMSPRGRSAISG